MQLSWYELELYGFLEGTTSHKRAWDLPFLFHILLSLKINSQNIQFDNNLSACSMEWLKVNVFYQLLCIVSPTEADWHCYKLE